MSFPSYVFVIREEMLVAIPLLLLKSPDRRQIRKKERRGKWSIIEVFVGKGGRAIYESRTARGK